MLNQSTRKIHLRLHCCSAFFLLVPPCSAVCPAVFLAVLGWSEVVSSGLQVSLQFWGGLWWSAVFRHTWLYVELPTIPSLFCALITALADHSHICRVTAAIRFAPFVISHVDFCSKSFRPWTYSRFLLIQWKPEHQGTKRLGDETSTRRTDEGMKRLNVLLSWCEQ